MWKKIAANQTQLCSQTYLWLMSNKKYIIHTRYRTTCSYFCIPNKLLVILVRELHAVTIDSCQNSNDMRALNSFCIRAAMHNSSLSIALYCLTLTHAYTCENLLHKQKHSCDLRFDCFIALQAHTYAHSYIYTHYHTYIYTYIYITWACRLLTTSQQLHCLAAG